MLSYNRSNCLFLISIVTCLHVIVAEGGGLCKSFAVMSVVMFFFCSVHAKRMFKQTQ